MPNFNLTHHRIDDDVAYLDNLAPHLKQTKSAPLTHVNARPKSRP